MIKRFNANLARLRRHRHIRRRLIGVSSRPRLNVFRSGQHIYAQIIDDTTGKTLVAASSLDESLQDFKALQPVNVQPRQEEASAEVETGTVVAEVIPGKGKEAKAGKAAKPQAKGGKPEAQAKTVLPAAQKRERKTPKEALAPIANNRKVALAREVGKLIAERAKEKGVSRVVFDRGGYAYHGRVAALAEGAREVGLDF
jgi:ribosomal protein L18